MSRTGLDGYNSTKPSAPRRSQLGRGFAGARLQRARAPPRLTLPGHAQGLSVEVRPFFHAAATAAAMAEHEVAG